MRKLRSGPIQRYQKLGTRGRRTRQDRRDVYRRDARTSGSLAINSRDTDAPLKILPLCENGVMARVRMDKWLWAARFFKTRALAARACELGRIASNGQKAKSSREVLVGDLLQVRNDAGDFQVEVVLLSDPKRCSLRLKTPSKRILTWNPLLW